MPALGPTLHQAVGELLHCTPVLPLLSQTGFSRQDCVRCSFTVTVHQARPLQLASGW